MFHCFSLNQCWSTLALGRSLKKKKEKSYLKGDELRPGIKTNTCGKKKIVLKATMKLITCQRAHYSGKGTSPTRSGQKRHSGGTLVSMSHSAGAGWHQRSSKPSFVSSPRSPRLWRAVPLVHTSRSFARPLIKPWSQNEKPSKKQHIWPSCDPLCHVGDKTQACCGHRCPTPSPEHLCWPVSGLSNPVFFTGSAFFTFQKLLRCWNADEWRFGWMADVWMAGCYVPLLWLIVNGREKPREICNFTRGKFVLHLAACCCNSGGATEDDRHSSVTWNLQKLPRLCTFLPEWHQIVICNGGWVHHIQTEAIKTTLGTSWQRLHVW